MPTRHPLTPNRNSRRTETRTLSCIVRQVHAHSSPQRRSRRWVTPMWCPWLAGSSTGRLKASPSSQREGEGRSGKEGLIHLSELPSWMNPIQNLHEGQRLPLRILFIDAERHRLALSLRQADNIN